MKKLLILLATALLAGCVGVAPTTPIAKPANTQINVCYSSATAISGVLVYALEKNIFAKYGLDVNLTYVEGGSTATTALIANDFDICQVAGVSVVNAGVAGANLVIIAGQINTYPFSLMVTPEINAPEDLRGRVLGISEFGGSSDTAMRVALKSIGLQPDEDVTIVAVGGQNQRIAAMESGAIAGTMVSIPQTVRARSLGYRELLNMAELNAPYQHTVLATSKQFLTYQRETTRHFLEATIDAVIQMKSDRQGVIDVMAEHLLLDKVADKAELEEAYTILVTDYILERPYPSDAGIQIILDELAVENPVAANLTPADIIDTSLLEELSQSGFWERLQP